MKRFLSILVFLSASLALTAVASACGGNGRYAPDGNADYDSWYPDPQLSDLSSALMSDETGPAEWLIERLPLSEVMAESGGKILHRHLMKSEWEAGYSLNTDVTELKLRVLRAMLEAGADANAQGLVGHTPLMTLALRGENSPMGARQVDLLVEHGAEVDGTAPGGVTALQVALYANATHIAAALLRHGADPALQDADGVSADALAHQRGLANAAAFAEPQQEARLKQP